MNKRHLNDHKTSLSLFFYIWLLYAVVCMTKNCFSGSMAAIVNEGIMTKSQTGLITAFFYIVYGPLQVVGGRFADRYRPDIIILIGLLGAAAANLIIFFNQNYYVMLITWTLNGCLQFGIWPATFKIISSQLAHEHRIRGVYYISFTTPIGMCFAFISGAIMTRWQDNFLLSAILLFALAIGLLIIYPRAERKMVADDGLPAKSIHEDLVQDENLDTRSFTMFKKCGLYIFVIALIIRNLLDMGVKNFAPTLLMESYEHISPSIGNILNIFIILLGVLGTFAMKLLYPKYIKNEVKGQRTLFYIIVPFLFLMLFVGKVNVVLIFISLAMISSTTAGMSLLVSYFSMRFAKYGKNGEVAGTINFGAALGIVVQSYGIALVADIWGWKAALGVLLGLAIVAIILISIVLPKWRRFTREYDI